MHFDPNNNIVKLCAQGMQLEGQGKAKEAFDLFNFAWTLATNDLEKFTAAHYVARHQDNTTDKLKWDIISLTYALKVGDTETSDIMPSLYLNIAKCYEDLNELEQALENYRLGFSFVTDDMADGYPKMIKIGLTAGLTRTLAKYGKTEETNR